MKQPVCRNPVLRGFHPDPTVCRVGNLFVCATSTFAWCPGLPIHVSTDLVNWRLVGHALPEAPGLTDLDVGDGLYAPGLRHDGRRFLLSCTVVDRRRQRFANFFTTAENPAGPWSAPIWLPESLGRIDPTPFIDDDGRLYVTLNDLPAQKTPEGGNRVIKLWELDTETFQPKDGPWILWDGALKRAGTPEAPRLFRRDGWYWLLIAEGGTGFSHAVTMARARDLRGPWEPCPCNPLLTHRHLGPDAALQCVGHADLVQAADDSWWALALATRPQGGGAILNRETVLLPVRWDAGAWPVFAPGVGQVPLRTPYPAGESCPLSAIASPWLGLRGLPDCQRVEGAWQLAANPVKSDAKTGVPGLAARRLTELSGKFSANISLDEGVNGGLILIADNRWQVTLIGDGTQVHLRVVRQGESSEIASLPWHPNLALHWSARGIVAVIGKRRIPVCEVNLLARADFTGAAVGLLATGSTGYLHAKELGGTGCDSV